MTLFGTIRRSRSVTVTTTRTAHARTSTSASTVRPKSARHPTSSAARDDDGEDSGRLDRRASSALATRSCLLRSLLRGRGCAPGGGDAVEGGRWTTADAGHDARHRRARRQGRLEGRRKHGHRTRAAMRVPSPAVATTAAVLAGAAAVRGSSGTGLAIALARVDVHGRRPRIAPRRPGPRGRVARPPRRAHGPAQPDVARRPTRAGAAAIAPHGLVVRAPRDRPRRLQGGQRHPRPRRRRPGPAERSHGGSSPSSARATRWRGSAATSSSSSRSRPPPRRRWRRSSDASGTRSAGRTRVDGGVVEIDASIGWAVFPDDGAYAGGAAGAGRRADVRDEARLGRRFRDHEARLARRRDRARVRGGAEAERGRRPLPADHRRPHRGGCVRRGARAAPASRSVACCPRPSSSRMSSARR